MSALLLVHLFLYITRVDTRRHHLKAQMAVTLHVAAPAAISTDQRLAEEAAARRQSFAIIFVNQMNWETPPRSTAPRQRLTRQVTSQITVQSSTWQEEFNSHDVRAELALASGRAVSSSSVHRRGTVQDDLDQFAGLEAHFAIRRG